MTAVPSDCISAHVWQQYRASGNKRKRSEVDLFKNKNICIVNSLT